MGEQNVIRLRGVTIYHTDDPFGSRSEKKLLQQGELILSDLNFDINAGEFVYLIGRVGSGKSSLLKTLYAELQLIEGEGYVAGFDLRKLKRREIPMLRRRIGIVFQDYQLLTDRNVFMNLYYVMKATGVRRIPGRHARSGHHRIDHLHRHRKERRAGRGGHAVQRLLLGERTLLRQ